MFLKNTLFILFAVNWFVLGNGENQFSFFEVHYEFHDAQSFCIEIGGRLFEPTDMNIMINVSDYANAEDIGVFWLGLHDKGDNSTFVYASNNVPIDWNNWASGHPDNNSKGKTCVQALQNGQWDDLSCVGYERSIVCMKGIVARLSIADILKIQTHCVNCPVLNFWAENLF